MRRKRGCVDYRLVASHNDTVKVESHHFNTLSVLKSLIVLCNISKKSSSSPPPPVFDNWHFSLELQRLKND